MLTPDDLPMFIADKREYGRVVTTVVHSYPEGWTEEESDQHRYDMCPCSPEMTQVLGTGLGYRWVVKHTRIPKTEGRT